MVTCLSVVLQPSRLCQLRVPDDLGQLLKDFLSRVGLSSAGRSEPRMACDPLCLTVGSLRTVTRCLGKVFVRTLIRCLFRQKIVMFE